MFLKNIDFKIIKGFIAGMIFSIVITWGVANVVFANVGTFEGLNIVNVTVNNKMVLGDVPAVVLNGRTLVPLKFVSEALGATVTWDDNTKTANVISNVKNASETIVISQVK